MPVAWTIGTSPSAELVNTMLDNAIQKLHENEHPIIHSDYAEEKTMPKKSKVCMKHAALSNIFGIVF